MRRIIVVGGGIVGVAAAAELAERGFSVMVIEQGPRDQLTGPTGHAPGYIGTFNESPILTALAQASVACYSELSQAGLKGFDQVGSLEIARTENTMNDLVRRAAKAREAGLEAQLISAASAATLAPDLIDVQNCVGAVLYAKDGTARASVITSALRERATHAGACFVYDARVTDIETRGGRVNAVYTEAGSLPADDVITACGIWGPTVAALAGYKMPLTPVAHPYVFGPVHSKLFQMHPSYAGPTLMFMHASMVIDWAWARTITSQLQLLWRSLAG